MKSASALLAASLFAGALLIADSAQAEQPPAGAIVRIAELEIDPTQLETFKAAVTEEMTDSLRIEPGVHAIYAVAEKDAPTKLIFVEIYANQQAVESHRNTPHFRKYLEATKGDMIRARRIIETSTIQLSAKP